VPDGAIGFTVCKLSVKAPQRKTYGADLAKDVSAKLNSLRVEKFDGICRTGRGPSMLIVFRYAQGPPAAVAVWSKECGVDDRFLRGAISSDLINDMSGLLA
jgi:hypothetical protein